MYMVYYSWWQVMISHSYHWELWNGWFTKPGNSWKSVNKTLHRVAEWQNFGSKLEAVWLVLEIHITSFPPGICYSEKVQLVAITNLSQAWLQSVNAGWMVLLEHLGTWSDVRGCYQTRPRWSFATPWLQAGYECWFVVNAGDLCSLSDQFNLIKGVILWV